MAKAGLTYADLRALPDDAKRYELVDGTLLVTPAPGTAHGWAVMVLCGELYAYARRSGGRVHTAPTDVVFDERNVVQPDVLYVRPEHLTRFERRSCGAHPTWSSKCSRPPPPAWT